MRLPLGSRNAAIWGIVAAGMAGATVAVTALLGLTDVRLVIPSAALAAISGAGARLQIEASRHVDRHVKLVARQLPELRAAAEFAAMDVPYPLPVGRRWALNWDACSILAREIAATRPATVVELGSGGSSLVIGLVLQRIGHGHLLTLDHEPEFAGQTRRHVTALGLDAWVSVLDAPLVDQDVRGRRYRWYELPSEIQNLPRVDFLVVDGPPQRVAPDGEPRYPALPVFAERMASDGVVFVDDAYRSAEIRMLERWLAEEPGWTSQVLKTQGGTAILRRKPAVA